jgi:hypothetical protein
MGCFVFHPEMDNGNITLLQGKRQVGIVWWRISGRKTVELEHLQIRP